MTLKGFWGNKIPRSKLRGISSIKSGGLFPPSGFCLILFLLVLLACEGSRESALRPQVGTKAPDFAAQDLKGHTWTLDQVKGSVVLLRFWTDQCPYCRFEMPVIERYYRRLKPAGFEVLAVNVKQSPQVAEAFKAQMDITFPVLLDSSGKMAEQYKVVAVPTNFLIDRNGVIRGKLIGEAFKEEKNLRKFLQNYFPEKLFE
jgi:cytochrome c biogenesis protein CcmG/thiol:disulfide interchange protein DsbE